MKNRVRFTQEELMGQMKLLEVMLKRRNEGSKDEQQNAHIVASTIASTVLTNAFVDPMEDYNDVLSSRPMQDWCRGSDREFYIDCVKILISEIVKYYGPDQYIKASGELKKFLKLEEADEKLDIFILETQLNAETNRCVSEDAAWNAVSLMRRGEGVVKTWQDKYKVCWPESVVDEDDESMSEFKHWLLINDVENDVILMVASSERERKKRNSCQSFCEVVCREK